MFACLSTFLTPAIALGSISKVAALADAACGAFAVVQALPALASASVTSSRVSHVDVIIALTWLAAPRGLRGVTMVTWSTPPTSIP